MDASCTGWFHGLIPSARISLLRNDKKLEKELTSLVNGVQIERYMNPEAPDIFDKSIIRKIVSTLSEGGKGLREVSLLDRSPKDETLLPGV